MYIDFLYYTKLEVRYMYLALWSGRVPGLMINYFKDLVHGRVFFWCHLEKT